jgi:hypothetical protein
MEPLPNVAKAFSIVQQQERHRSSDLGDGKFVQTLSTNTWKNNNNQNKGKSKQNPCRPNTGKICSFCGKENHSVDTCFFKNGFPANFKFKNKNQSASVNSITTKTSAASSSGNNTFGNMILTNEDYALLADMIKKVKMETGEHSINNITHSTSTHHDSKGNFLDSFWIVDSGATDHVCNNLSCFSSFQNIPPIIVHLPNGQKSCAMFSGTVHFSPDLYLTDVLYIKDFSFNILSVHRIICSLNLQILFDEHECFLQDKQSKRTIGLAKVQ